MASDVYSDVENSVDTIIWKEVSELAGLVGLANKNPNFHGIAHAGVLSVGPYSAKCYRMLDGSVAVDLEEIIEVLKMYEARDEFEKLFQFEENMK